MRGYKIPNYENNRFGKLTVIKYIKNICKWECVCDCGKRVFVKSGSLTTGNTKSCGCTRREKIIKRNISNKIYNRYEDISGDYFGSVKNNAINRGLKFNISIKDMWNKFLEQNRKCNLTGVDIFFDDINQTASLDRINNKDDYNIDNIQWLNKDINLLKFDFDQDYFIYLCSRIDYFNKFIFKRLDNTNFSNYEYNYLKSYYKRSIIKGAEIRKLECSISIDFLIDLFLKQGKRCSFSGLKIWFSKVNLSIQTASLDRINSEVGYNENNVEWVHKNINRMKMKRNNSCFLNLCKLVSIYNGGLYEK